MRASRLPSPPQEYDVQYMRQLIRDMEAVLQSSLSSTAGRFTTMNISQLPTSSVGLNPGDLWNDSGTVKVA